MKKLFLVLLLCSSHLFAQKPFPKTVEGLQLSNVANTKISKVTSGSPPLSTTIISPTKTLVPAAQWHFAGHNEQYFKPGSLSSDWLYSIVATDKKEYLSCGYTHMQMGGNVSGVVLKLDHLGNLAWSIHTNNVQRLNFDIWHVSNASSFVTTPTTFAVHNLEGGSVLWQLAKANDGYVAVGYVQDDIVGHSILIIEFDDNGNLLNGSPIAVVPPTNPGTTNFSGSSSNSAGFTFSIPNCRGYSVAIDPNTNSINNIIVSGVAGEKDPAFPPNERAFVLTMNYNGTVATPGVASQWSLGSICYAGNNINNGGPEWGGNILAKLVTESTGPTSYKIYGCGSISSTGDHKNVNADPYGTPGSKALQLYDKDIWVVSMEHSSGATSFTSLNQDTYNKSNIPISYI